MTIGDEVFERAVRATCAPRRRTIGEWLYDNAGWLIVVGWGAIVVGLAWINDVMRTLEATR